MDYLPTRLPTQIESLVLLLATGSLYFILTYFIWNSEDESPVHFTVQTPEQCNRGWKGQVIDEPSIKVWTFYASNESQETLAADPTLRSLG